MKIRLAQDPGPRRITICWSFFSVSIRIALTDAALNGLDVVVADIRNNYLQATSSQKDYIICGPEC